MPARTTTARGGGSTPPAITSFGTRSTPRFSENHAARYVDLDGDGVPELITGKRYWAHLGGDAGARDPVVLVAYRHHLEAGEVIWDRIDIDDDSGVGSHEIEVLDVDGDARPDIVVSSKKGLFLFLQE